MFEIHESVGGPELGLQFFAREQFAWLFEKHGEDLKGTAGEANFVAVFAQLASTQVDAISAEADLSLKWNCIRHSGADWEA
jgi:hypothetical protein